MSTLDLPEACLLYDLSQGLSHLSLSFPLQAGSKGSVWSLATGTETATGANLRRGGEGTALPAAPLSQGGSGSGRSVPTPCPALPTGGLTG